MKIDFLTDVNPESPTDAILRLSEFETIEVKNMLAQINDLIESGKGFTLSDTTDRRLPIIVRLFLGADKGVIQKSDNEFECELTVDRYHEMRALIEPFARKLDNSYQWLYDLETPIDLLLSPRGDW